jgi:pimeloyl-ACP methyl ester carboxylesterase
MPRLEHKRVNLAGINVHYTQAGEGPVVLLVHGLGTSSVTWGHNIEPLAAAGYTVLAPDLPGHGDSDKPRSLSYSPETGARLIQDFLDALDVDRVSLVGNSAGGLISGFFALDHPLRVERLVLVASGGLGRDVSWALRILSVPLLGELIYQPMLLRMLGVGNRLFYRPPAFPDGFLPESSRSDPESRRVTIKAIRSSITLFGQKKRWRILDRLAGLAAPILTVWGTEDRYIPVSHAHLIGRALPRSEVRTITECGHWPHMERADEFNALLIRFLEAGLDDAPPSSIP